jgi:glycosyltransferase involved in cell wall biosynthesis
MMFKPCVIIPVYDHEHAIAAVVRGVQRHGVHVLLVDDGSNEACAAELRRLSESQDVTLLRHERNRGKGAAVCTGFRAAHEAGFTHALQVDADGQHALEDIARVIDVARANPDAVICGRPIFDSSIPKSRYYGRYLTHVLVWLETLSFEIRDSMCGFRLYPLEAVIALLDRHGVGPRMDFDTDIIVRLHWRGVATRWVDTRVVYPADGVSHFRMFFDNARMTSLHVRLVLGMLVRAPMLIARKFSRRTLAQRTGQPKIKATR